MIVRSLPAVLVLASASLARAPLFQDEEPLQPPAAEGPLANDCFLPASEEAGALLRRGDDALERAREAESRGASQEAERLRVDAFEAWRTSLVENAVGTSVWREPPDAVDRRLTEGLRYAVLRRLDELTAEERASWTTRFDPLAGAELATAWDATSLETVEWTHPGTFAAARAALIAGDRRLEAGRLAEARSLWERGARACEWIGDAAAEVRAAIERRVATVPGEVTAPLDEAWTSARALAPGNGLFLFDEALRINPGRLPPPRTGLRPGLAFLGKDRLAVQTATRVHLLQVHADGKLGQVAVFEPAELLPGFVVESTTRLVRRPPGWRLLPAADRGDLFLVHGRADDSANALIALSPPPLGRDPSAKLADLLLPRLKWAVVGDLRIESDGGVTSIPELEALETLEFQPGVAVRGERVIVQARELADELRAWLLAFDRTSGALLWKRFVAQGADLFPDVGRLGAPRGMRLAAQPLLAAGSAVFAGTHLGAGVLVDSLSGEPVWSVKNRRRDPTRPGWDGDRPVLSADAVLWAPVDSDRLYALRAEPLASGANAGEALFTARPRAIGEAEFFLGGEPDGIVVLGRAGAEETVTERRERGTNRIDALYLGPEERFQGRGLVSRERVYACTDRGLYLFDRSRELFLLDYAPLPRAQACRTRGGDLYARGDLVLALSRDGIWSFRVR